MDLDELFLIFIVYKIRDNNLNLRVMKKLVLSIGLVVASSLIGFSQNSNKLINNILSGNYETVISETRSSDFTSVVLYIDNRSVIYDKFTPGLFLHQRPLKNAPISLNESDLVNELTKIKNFIGLNSLNDLNKSTSIDTLMWIHNHDDFKIVQGVGDITMHMCTKMYYFNKTENDKTTSCQIVVSYTDNKLTYIGLAFHNSGIYR